jgi:hypothetical protein
MNAMTRSLLPHCRQTMGSAPYGSLAPRVRLESLRLTAWKARHLACCREAPGRGRTLPADAGTAWRHGLRVARATGAVVVAAGSFLIARAAGLG